MRTQAKLDAFAAKVKSDVDARLARDGCSWTVRVRIVHGKRWTKVDQGDHGSEFCHGRFMVDRDGTIHGIKGYGKVHMGHTYGTLDTIDAWDFGPYTPWRIA